METFFDVSWLHVGAFGLEAFLLLVIGNRLYDLTTKFDDEKLITGDAKNFAVALRTVYLTAYALGLSGPLLGSTDELMYGLPLVDMGWMAVDAGLIFVALMISGFVSSRVLLRGINNDEHVEKGNLAVAALEAGNYLAIGLILKEAFTFNDDMSYIDAGVFFVCGQVTLIVFFWIYEAITSFQVKEEIKDGNTSAGIVAGAMLLALGIVIAGAISGPFVDLTTDLLLIAKASTQGIVMLLAIRLLSSKFILRTTNIKHEIVTDHNHAAALKHAFALIAMAIVTRAIIF